MYMDAEGNTLATELLHEIKASAKRWFIIAIVELILILAMAGGFVWYISLPVDDVAIENDSGNANYIGNDFNGELNNGKDKSDTPSNQEPENVK